MKMRKRNMASRGFVKFGGRHRGLQTGDPNWRQRFPGPVVHSVTLSPAYPTCPWESSESELHFSADTLGVAFFINEGGLFLTAAHVVRDHAGSDTPLKILYPDLIAKVIFTLRVSKLAIHPDLDVAIGLARVPLEVDLQRIVLGDGEIPVGESVRVFGYAHSSFVDQEGQSRPLGGSGLLGLTANIVCAFHLREIPDRSPRVLASKRVSRRLVTLPKRWEGRVVDQSLVLSTTWRMGSQAEAVCCMAWLLIFAPCLIGEFHFLEGGAFGILVNGSLCPCAKGNQGRRYRRR